MPDVAVLPLAVVGLIVLAGGGGWLFQKLSGRKTKRDE